MKQESMVNSLWGERVLGYFGVVCFEILSSWVLSNTTPPATRIAGNTKYPGRPKNIENTATPIIMIELTNESNSMGRDNAPTRFLSAFGLRNGFQRRTTNPPKIKTTGKR